jgi:hypothetical protein
MQTHRLLSILVILTAACGNVTAGDAGSNDPDARVGGPDGGGGGGPDGGGGGGPDASVPGPDAAPPGWDPFERIGHDDLANEVSNFNPQVAVAPNGDALVIFYDQNEVWARRWVKATESWDPLHQLNTSATRGVNPQLAIDGQGNAIVVWGAGLLNFPIFMTTFTASLGWPQGWGAVAELQPAPGTGRIYSVTSVAMTADGSAVVGWEYNDQSGGNIRESWIQLYEAGYGWDAPYEVSGAATTAYGPQVGIAQVGNDLRVVASWYQSDAGRLNVRGNVYTYSRNSHSGSSLGPTSLESDDTLDALSPQVDVDDAGNAMVAFIQRNSTNSIRHVLANRYTGTWSGASAVNPADGASDFHLDTNGAGDSVVVWRQCAADCSIWARAHTDGTWQGAMQVSSADNSAGNAEVAIDGDGRALMIWTANSAAIESIWASELGPGGWSPEHLLEDDNTNFHGTTVAIGFGANGTGLAAWVREANDALMRRSIFGALFRD